MLIPEKKKVIFTKIGLGHRSAVTVYSPWNADILTEGMAGKMAA